MGLLSMTDCSVAENRAQALREIGLAENRSTPLLRDFDLARWAEKWGRELLGAANDAPDEDAITDAVNEARNEHGAELEKLRSELAEKIGDIREALDEMEQL